MTLAKAQACMAAIAGAGFDVTAHLDTSTGSWSVRAMADSMSIDSAQISALVSSQTVIGKTSIVEFS